LPTTISIVPRGSTDALVVPVAIFGSLRHTKIVAATIPV
jgi:hypothetical protein